MSNNNVSTPKKPGRRAETPTQRLQRLQSEMKLAEQAVKAHRDRTLASLAAALVEEAQANPEFMEAVQEILPRRVTAKSALPAMLELLGISRSSKRRAA